MPLQGFFFDAHILKPEFIINFDGFIKSFSW